MDTATQHSSDSIEYYEPQNVPRGPSRSQQIWECIKSNPDVSTADVAKIANIQQSHVSSVLTDLTARGMVLRRAVYRKDGPPYFVYIVHPQMDSYSLLPHHKAPTKAKPRTKPKAKPEPAKPAEIVASPPPPAPPPPPSLRAMTPKELVATLTITEAAELYRELSKAFLAVGARH